MKTLLIILGILIAIAIIASGLLLVWFDAQAQDEKATDADVFGVTFTEDQIGLHYIWNDKVTATVPATPCNTFGINCK